MRTNKWIPSLTDKDHRTIRNSSWSPPEPFNKHRIPYATASPFTICYTFKGARSVYLMTKVRWVGGWRTFDELLQLEHGYCIGKEFGNTGSTVNTRHFTSTLNEYCNNRTVKFAGRWLCMTQRVKVTNISNSNNTIYVHDNMESWVWLRNSHLRNMPFVIIWQILKNRNAFEV